MHPWRAKSHIRDQPVVLRLLLFRQILRGLVGRSAFGVLLTELHFWLPSWRRRRRCRLAILVAAVRVLCAEKRLHCLDRLLLRRLYKRALPRCGRRRRGTRALALLAERTTAPSTPSTTTTHLSRRNCPGAKHCRNAGRVPFGTPARLLRVEPIGPAGNHVRVTSRHVHDLEALATCVLDVQDGSVSGALNALERAHANVRLDHDDVVAGVGSLLAAAAAALRRDALAEVPLPQRRHGRAASKDQGLRGYLVCVFSAQGGGGGGLDLGTFPLPEN